MSITQTYEIDGRLFEAGAGVVNLYTIQKEHGCVIVPVSQIAGLSAEDIGAIVLALAPVASDLWDKLKDRQSSHIVSSEDAERRERAGKRRRAFRKARKIAIERDGHKCQECGASEALVVHHIDKDKGNNGIDNLITLCRSCHTPAIHKGADAGEWREIFAEIIQEKKQ